MTIYLDNAATTQTDKRVLKVMKPYFSEIYGNPGSMHSLGLKAKKALDNSREIIARVLGCTSEEIIFTGSGTESINMAIKGVALANKSKGSHIITQKTEHPAVLETCEFLETQGYQVTYLDTDKLGMVNPKDVENEIKKNTILVTIMYANNEIGTIQPIKEISKICRKKNVIFHTDACQATGYLDINVQSLGIDLMSINGSKIYGPKGMGVLYRKKDIPLKALIHGGGQELRLRSGTENIPSIVGFTKALELAVKEREQETKRLTKLRNKLIKGILKKVPKSFLNGHPEKRLPNNANISILDVEGESILLYLDKHGIYASTGSACSSKTLDPSHVVIALGLPYEAAHGSLRFSLGRFNTEEDIDEVLKILPKVVEKIREISPVILNKKDFPSSNQKIFINNRSLHENTKEKKATTMTTKRSKKTQSPSNKKTMGANQNA